MVQEGEHPPPPHWPTGNKNILYNHIPPCPPEGVAVSEDEEGGHTVLGICPEKGEKGVFTHACSWSLSYSPSNQVLCSDVNATRKLRHLKYFPSHLAGWRGVVSQEQRNVITGLLE